MDKYVFTNDAWKIYSRFMQPREVWDFPPSAEKALLASDGYYEVFSFHANEKHACKSLVGMRMNDDGITRTLLWSEGHDFATIVQHEYEERRTRARNIGRTLFSSLMIVLLGLDIFTHPIMQTFPNGTDAILALLTIIGAAISSVWVGLLGGFVAQEFIRQTKVSTGNFDTLKVSSA